jgi:Glycosyltransferase family 29 (sialyltransferase)
MRPGGAGGSGLRSRLRNVLSRGEATDDRPSDARVRRVAELIGSETRPNGSAAAEQIYRHSAEHGATAPYRPAPLGAAAGTVALRTPDEARELRDFVVSDLLAADADAVREWSGVRIDRGANRRLAGTATAFEPMDLGGLREYIRDRSVAVVVDDARLAGTALGPRIDACDIVVRFDAFATDEHDAGVRTDVHVAANVTPENWDVPVTLRIVMSGSVRTWRSGIIARLDPAAQRFVGTEALRWPLYSPTAVGAPKAEHESSLAFQMIRLLDFLGVAASVEVFGLPAPVAGTASAAEHSWLTERAHLDQSGVLSLRGGSARRSPA